jgi:hypothetical protein
MAKPTDLPRWAEEVDGTPATNIVEPNAGKKDLGWTTGGDVPTSDGLNWYMRLVYKWAQWLDGLQGEALTWAENQTFSKLLALTGGSLQSILKGGTGGLDIGTSIATDLRFLVNNAWQWMVRESDGALVSNGKQLKGIADPNSNQDAVTMAWAGNHTLGAISYGLVIMGGPTIYSSHGDVTGVSIARNSTGFYTITDTRMGSTSIILATAREQSVNEATIKINRQLVDSVELETYLSGSLSDAVIFNVLVIL